MCLFQSEILSRFKVSVHFPKNMFFFQEPLIRYWKPSFFYLPNLKKIFRDILNNTEKNDLKVALFLECRSSNLPLATAILTQAMHILIFLKLHCFKFISHVFKPAKDIYMGEKTCLTWNI